MADHNDGVKYHIAIRSQVNQTISFYVGCVFLFMQGPMHTAQLSILGLLVQRSSTDSTSNYPGHKGVGGGYALTLSVS